MDWIVTEEFAWGVCTIGLCAHLVKPIRKAGVLALLTITALIPFLNVQFVPALFIHPRGVITELSRGNPALVRNYRRVLARLLWA